MTLCVSTGNNLTGSDRAITQVLHISQLLLIYLFLFHMTSSFILSMTSMAITSAETTTIEAIVMRLEVSTGMGEFWHFYTVAVCDCVLHLYDFLHSRSLRLCIASVRFLTQSQSSTVYFICTISNPDGAAAGYCICLFWQHFSDLYLRHALTDFN